MASLFLLTSGFASQVTTGGQSVQVANTTLGVHGGLIINPLAPQDQGLPSAESLWVNILGPAATSAVNQTAELQPGQKFLVPKNTNVWVNAASSGHNFSAYFTQAYTVPYPPTVVPGQPGSGTGATIAGYTGGQPFPPQTVTGLTSVIPSYLYQEYSDDDDLQEFVAAQNQCQQDYVDTFNALNLPIYTGPTGEGNTSLVAGALLDWVGTGLYGMLRPALDSGQPVVMGPLNTWGPNWIYPNWNIPPANISLTFGLNELQQLSVGDIVVTDDDLYRRILTWHLFKGDGNYFSIRWLKRRVWRFCYGPNGSTPDFAVDPMLTYAPHPSGWADLDDAFIADTEQISISAGVDQNITIRFVLGKRKVTGGALINAFGCNGFEPAIAKTPPWDIGSQTKGGITLNDLETTYTPYLPVPYMAEFKFALDAGVLEVPFHFNFTSTIG